ncbi:MAG: amylo-alpha-1,6-glucosidase [Kiritimatiellae bacterium]|nr:amylo-alpha-1,6-glucosidase [Kiritimatiellia bacterium]MDD5520455.1 amylo-alpha-1,6-glucosidase [Kiritimatiellia bacterium]
MGIRFTRDQCLNLETSLRQEWIDTNGLGGYASSTILDCHTRKYHGLLVANLKKPAGRFALLSKLEVSIRAGDSEFRLSTNKYPGVFDPTGHKYIESFEYKTFPVTNYVIGDICLSKSVMIVYSEDTVLVRLDLHKAQKPVIVRALPLLSYRDLHGLTRQNMYLRVKTFPEDDGHKINPYELMPPMYLDWDGKMTFYPGPHWYSNVEYLKELSRGYDYQEDLFCPGTYEAELKPGESLIFQASLNKHSIPVSKVWADELVRRKKAGETFAGQPENVAMLKTHSEKFLITNNRNCQGIIAGYHWFGEWGRDTMIALPGLTFHCGQTAAGFNILKTWAEEEKNGLLPNILGTESSGNAYNSIDTSLWFFRAVQEYIYVTNDWGGVKRHLARAMQNIIETWLEGKTPLLKITKHGLVWAGTADTQLTWMDAKSKGKPVTPRHGMAVEINALWYNALCFYLEFCKVAKFKKPKVVTGCKQLFEKNFSRIFWFNDGYYLSDVVNEAGQDTSVRPNQILSVSLPYSPLSRAQMQGIINVVKDQLVTPYGLRTLSPKNSLYHPFYHGNQDQRDAAYHQGTVWPWLVGHFAEACLRIAVNKSAEKEYLRRTFEPLWSSHLHEFGLYGISEIFDGNPPHKAKGCITQAWSVAEIIRTLEMLKGNSRL